MMQFDADYTIVIPHEQACELICGRIPHDVLISLLSAVRSLIDTPAKELPRRARK
jgi:hypothetical protein